MTIKPPPFQALLIVLLLGTSTQGDGFPTPNLADINPAGIEGSLVICGGGKLPDQALDRFLELAGGEGARLVVVPTASERADDAQLDSYATIWRDRGFSTVDVLHTCDRTVADSEAFIAPIRSATAVWFVGGQQSRIAKAYVGTRVEYEVYVVASKPEFELLVHTKLEGDDSIFNASPVPLPGGGILLRSDKYLYRLKPAD